MEVEVKQSANWRERFLRAEVISMLDVNRRYNLAESTAEGLTFTEILKLAGGEAALGGLPMGYGSSAGPPRLRAVAAGLTGSSRKRTSRRKGPPSACFCWPSSSAAPATRRST